MRILVISQYYYPEQFRITDICEEFAHRGHDVTVICAPPNYPEGKIYPGYENESRQDEVVHGVHVIRVPARPRYQGSINLARSYLSYMLQASWKVLRMHGDFDIIYVWEISPVSLGFPAIIARKKWHIPALFYCLDVWPDAIKEVVHNEKSLLYQATRWFSSFVYNGMDFVLVKSKSFKPYLQQVCHVPADKIDIMYEHAEEGYLCISEEPERNDVVDFMFLGNIGKSQQCEVIVDAVRELDASLPFIVHFVGSGSMLSSVQHRVQDYGLEDKILFHGRHPLDEMPKYYNLADVCILTLSDNDASCLTVPAKLQGYMAAARPVVAATSGDAQEVIEESGCGFCVNSGDSHGLARDMLYCIDHQEKLTEMGKKGRKFFLQNYTKKIFMDKMDTLFNRMVSMHHNDC